MKRLIINADDYGRSPDISRGIREAHLYGVVTSTTCMMNIPTTAHDIAISMKETPRLGIGVHLVLTMGKPILPREAVPSLVDVSGNLYKYDPFITNLPYLQIDEVKAEWRAQIEAFINVAEKKPDHLDSHHHSSYFSPALFRGMLELAKEYDCPIRFPFTGEISGELEITHPYVSALIDEFDPRHPDVFVVDFYDEQATHEMLMQIINNVEEGSTEVMCHPGFVPDAFVKESVYNKPRQRELGILLDPAIKQALNERGIEMINFSNL